jgi:transposase
MPKPPFNQDSNQVTPKPELEKRTRRKFSMEYKLRIIAEADACQHGELGALLRRESLYSNQLRDWRAEFRNSGAEGLSKTAPGPKASKTVEQRRIEQLEKENSRLNRKLQTMEDCLELQKKVLRMLDHAQDGNER